MKKTPLFMELDTTTHTHTHLSLSLSLCCSLACLAKKTRCVAEVERSNTKTTMRTQPNRSVSHTFNVRTRKERSGFSRAFFFFFVGISRLSFPITVSNKKKKRAEEQVSHTHTPSLSYAHTISKRTKGSVWCSLLSNITTTRQARGTHTHMWFGGEGERERDRCKSVC